MMQGSTLAEAVEDARSAYSTYAPIQSNNLVLAGDTNITINDTYNLRGEDILDVPNSFVKVSSNNDNYIYKKYYHGIETTDKIVYNGTRKRYLVNRNIINDNQLSSIDFTLIDHNRSSLLNSSRIDDYDDLYEYITLVNNQATVVIVGSKIENDTLVYDCIDLRTNELITDQVDFFADIF